MSDQHDDFALRRQLRQLPREIEPGQDLWPGIERRLAAPIQRRRPWHAWAAAAALAALALLALPVSQSPDPAAPLATTPPLATPYSAVERQADAMSIEYRAALAQLAAVPLPDELEPAARELRASERALRAALRRDPEQTWLLAQLRRTYEQQLRLSQLAAYG